MTIVVSEETGGVTITKNSELLRDLTQNDYLKLLRNELIPKQEVKNDNILTKFVDGFAKSFKGGRKHWNYQSTLIQNFSTELLL